MKLFLKTVISIISACTMFLGLIGCHSRLRIETDEEKAIISQQAEAIALSILKATNNRDHESFDSMFTQYVLNLSDYSLGKNYTFDTFNGEIKSLVQLNLSTGGRISSDKTQCYDDASVTYRVTTHNNDSYLMNFSYYTNHISEKNKVREFKIYKESSNEDNNFHDMGLRYGVYYPGWIDGILSEH